LFNYLNLFKMKKIIACLIILLTLKDVNSQSVILPYFDNFETSNLWTANGDWQLGEASKSGFPSISDNKRWTTNLYSDYSNSSINGLESPYINLTNTVTPYVSFMLYYDTEKCCDSLQFQYSTNGDSIWKDLTNGKISRNWFNNNNSWSGKTTKFLKSTLTLDSIPKDDSIKFRFLFTTNSTNSGKGIAIDNFLISDFGNPTSDVETIFLGFDDDTNECRHSQRLGMIIQNNLDSNIIYQGNANTSLSYKINDGTPKTEFLHSGSILANDYYYHTFSASYASAYYYGDITAWSSFSVDKNASNDSIEFLRAFDQEIIEILSPSEYYPSGLDSFNVVVRVRNYHTHKVSKIPVVLKYNNSTIVDTIPSLNPLCNPGSGEFIFSKRLKFGSISNNKLKVWVDYPLDKNKANDTLELDVIIDSLPVIQLPYWEGFEDAESGIGRSNAGSTLPLDWYNSGQWGVRSGRSPSLIGGTDYGSGGKGNYLMNLSSTLEESKIYTPSISIPNTSNDIIIEFDLHHWTMIHGKALLLNVLKRDGTSQFINTSSTLPSYRGGPYYKFQSSLSYFKGDTISLQFKVVSENDTIGIDISVDNLKIFESSPYDLVIRKRRGYLNFYEEATFCSQYKDSTIINIALFNNGSNMLPLAEVCYQVNNDPAVCNTDSIKLMPFNEINYEFPQRADFSVPGGYSLKIYTNNDSDNVSFNDTLLYYFESTRLTDDVYDDFDSIIDSRERFQWDVSGDKYYFWKLNSGETNGNETGPNSDASGSQDGFYLYTESIDEGNFSYPISTSIELKECFSVDTTENKVLEFDYHMYGENIDKLYIEATKRWSSTILDSIVGEQQSSSSDPWKRKKVNLKGLNLQNTRLKFRGINTTGKKGHIALDNISIQNATSIGIEEKQNHDDFYHIYPNPSKGRLIIETNLANYSIRILSIDGQLLHSTKGNQRTSLSLENLAAGIYFIEISTSSTFTIKKFVLTD